jgi:hypothetical protein
MAFLERVRGRSQQLPRPGIEVSKYAVAIEEQLRGHGRKGRLDVDGYRLAGARPPIFFQHVIAFRASRPLSSDQVI